MNLDINVKINKINQLYDKLTYFDNYGTSVILFIILTIIVFVVHSYFAILSQFQPIKDDWINQRCKPQNIPFAGLINKPDDKTATEYTQENFNYCLQDVLTGVTGYAVQPLTFITGGLTDIYGNISNDIQSGRTMFSAIRNNLKNITQEITGRIINITVPIQQIVIAFRDVAAKTQGVLTAGLMTSLGTYYTLKSLLGAIVELIIIILIALAIVIVALWILPFTWGIAGSMTALFIAISIPLAIVVIFMSVILDIHTSGIPSVPSMKHCFDEDTLFIMDNGEEKSIKNINIGEKLQGGNEITCKIIVDSRYSKMYNLCGIIVSDSHMLYHNDKWIPVKNHPCAVLIDNYNKPFLYCFNTLFKEIRLNQFIFSDWDELYESSLTSLDIDKQEIHKYLHCGLSPDTEILMDNGNVTHLIDIKIGDILWNGIKVVGLVEMNGLTIHKLFEYNLGKLRISCSKNLYYYDDAVGKILNIDTINPFLPKWKTEIEKQPKLYHLLTNSSYFFIDKIKIYDYNSCIDMKI